MNVMLKSAYLPSAVSDGARYLVETLWPEGVDTRGLSPYIWARELAPSYYLKETAFWKHWNPEKIRTEYKLELQEPERRAWFTRVLNEAKTGTVTLLHNSRKRDPHIFHEDTSVLFLKEFLESELSTHPELPEPQVLSPPINTPEAVPTVAAEEWVNEGGK